MTGIQLQQLQCFFVLPQYLRVTPEEFLRAAEVECFALKGGTAINLFHDNMPRLSVDIDLTYVPMEDRKNGNDRNYRRTRSDKGGTSQER